RRGTRSNGRPVPRAGTERQRGPARPLPRPGGREGRRPPGPRDDPLHAHHGRAQHGPALAGDQEPAREGGAERRRPTIASADGRHFFACAFASASIDSRSASICFDSSSIFLSTGAFASGGAGGRARTIPFGPEPSDTT